MFKFEIINPPSFKLDDKIIKRIFLEVGNTINKEQRGILNIVFITPEEIQNLNKNYRNKDSVTDVLSFHYYNNFSELKEDDIAWEVVFCEEKIISGWVEYQLWSEKEFYKLLIHSLLHILWFDHEEENDYKIMNEFENKIWQEIFEKKG